MKPLISTLLTFCSLTVYAKNNPSKDSRHIILVDGIYTKAKVETTVNLPYGASYKNKFNYSTWGIAIGYRYSIISNLRAGINATYFSYHYVNNTNAFMLGVHIEAPFPITDDLLIGPNLNLSYAPFDNPSNAEFTPGASLGIMYKINKLMAVNLEPGFRYYFQKNNGYEIPIHCGLRILL